MVKYRNNQSVPIKLLKVNVYDLGTLQPGDVVDVVIDAETVELISKDNSNP